jgi:hypothetical protein
MSQVSNPPKSRSNHGGRRKADNTGSHPIVRGARGKEPAGHSSDDRRLEETPQHAGILRVSAAKWYP